LKLTGAAILVSRGMKACRHHRQLVLIVRALQEITMCQRSLMTLGLVVLCLGGFANLSKADDANDIQGTWRIIAVDGADKATPDDLKKLRIRITADQLIVERDQKKVNASPYKLNASKKPKEIDFVVKVFIDQKVAVVTDSQPRVGIYELTGDDLKICVAWATNKKVPNPEARPKEFKSGGDLTVMTLKRDK
jgi:uncharacterized protein (TIGR03067 family)